MKRRDFIKAGAATATVAGAAAAGGLAGSACGGLFEGSLFGEGKLPLPEMGAYIGKVDDGLRKIARGRPDGEAIGTGEYERELGKKALSALFLAGMFGDLPDEGQVHPAMQARLERQLPEMESAVYEMAAYLESVTDEDAKQLQSYLKSQDNPAMELAEWLDVGEGSLGVSRKRRLQTRALLTHVVSRLKNQPPRMLFDEYIGKVDRIEARTGSDEDLARELVARMGEDAFWRRQQRLAMAVAAWEDEGVSAEDFPMDDLPPVELPDAPEEWPEEPVEEPPEEADAGVEPEPVVAPTSQPPPRPEDLSMLSCAGLDEERSAIRAARLNREITDTEYQDRLAELRVHRAHKQCDGVKQVEQPFDPAELTSDKCRKIIRKAKRDHSSVRNQARKRTISRQQAQARVKQILDRRDLRYCQKQRKRRAGLVCLGIGGAFAVGAIVLIAVGGGLSDLGIAGMFMATPAAVLLIVGLVMLAGSSRIKV